MFVSRVRKTAKKNLRSPKNSLAGSLVSRGITVLNALTLSLNAPGAIEESVEGHGGRTIGLQNCKVPRLDTVILMT